MKNAFLTILFYVIAISLIAVINLSGQFKSGPCAPNLDFLSIVIFALLSLLLLAKNGVQAYFYHRPTMPSFFIHLIVIIIGIMILIAR